MYFMASSSIGDRSPLRRTEVAEMDTRRRSRWPARDTARSMSQENVDKTTAFLAAYNRRDFDAAVEFFDPEIEWVLPPHQRSDSCQGPDEVKRFWQGLD